LALFSSAAYTPLDLSTGESGRIDLQPHLTNTSLQTELGESNVRLLDELEGCHILSGNEEGRVLIRSHIDDLVKQMADVVAEVFRAALQNPVHFQAWVTPL
jgi:tubulin--tyrosine ligase